MTKTETNLVVKQVRKTPAQRSGVIAGIRIVMLQQGWTAKDVAARAGLDVRTTRNVLNENNRGPGCRARVEYALGRLFWHTQAQHDAIKKRWKKAPPALPENNL